MKLKIFQNLINRSKTYNQLSLNKPLIPESNPKNLNIQKWNQFDQVLSAIKSDDYSVASNNPYADIPQSKQIKYFKFENNYLALVDQELAVKLDLDEETGMLYFQQLHNLGIAMEEMPFDNVVSLSQDERSSWQRNKFYIPSMNQEMIDNEMMFRKVNEQKFIYFLNDGKWDSENSKHPLLFKEDIPLYQDDTRGGNRPYGANY